MCIRQIKIGEELSNTETSHLCSFCAFNRGLWLFISLLFAFLLLPPSKFHLLEQPSAALLPHRNLQIKMETNTNTHTCKTTKPQVLLLVWWCLWLESNQISPFKASSGQKKIASTKQPSHSNKVHKVKLKRDFVQGHVVVGPGVMAINRERVDLD